MKKLNQTNGLFIGMLAFLSISVFSFLIGCDGQSENKSEPQDTQVKEQTATKTYYYTCPMDDHKNVASKTPGNCPECGMKLVAAQETMADSADYFGCPMLEHSHIRHETAGKCEECGMDLKPMRLKSKETM